MTKYTVRVKTSDEKNAGTSAKVFIQLIGARTSDEETLNNPDHDDHERNSLDTHELDIREVGWIDRIRIGHDNSKRKPGWRVDYVEVRHDGLGLSWKANFDRWFAEGVGDGSLEAIKWVPEPDVEIVGPTMMTEYYMGYRLVPLSNNTSEPMDQTFTTTYSHSRTIGLKEGETRTLEANHEVGASFLWGLFETKLGMSISRTAMEEHSVQETEVDSSTTQVPISMPPNTEMTAIVLRFGVAFETPAIGGGLRFLITDRWFEFEVAHLLPGLVSFAEADEYVADLLRRLADEPDELDMDEPRAPSSAQPIMSERDQDARADPGGAVERLHAMWTKRTEEQAYESLTAHPLEPMLARVEPDHPRRHVVGPVGTVGAVGPVRTVGPARRRS